MNEPNLTEFVFGNNESFFHFDELTHLNERAQPEALFRNNENLNEVQITKKSVLAFLARIFDPLGFLSPFTIRFKMLLKNIGMAGKKEGL